MRNAGGGVRVILAYGAFKNLEPAFTSTPTTPDPQTMHEALNAPDAEDWTAAMDAEVNNTRRLSVSKEVLRPTDENFIAPRWVYRRKFESDTLIKYKAHLVARGSHRPQASTTMNHISMRS